MNIIVSQDARKYETQKLRKLWYHHLCHDVHTSIIVLQFEARHARMPPLVS